MGSTLPPRCRPWVSCQVERGEQHRGDQPGRAHAAVRERQLGDEAGLPDADELHEDEAALIAGAETWDHEIRERLGLPDQNAGSTVEPEKPEPAPAKPAKTKAPATPAE